MVFCTKGNSDDRHSYRQKTFAFLISNASTVVFVIPWSSLRSFLFFFNLFIFPQYWRRRKCRPPCTPSIYHSAPLVLYQSVYGDGVIPSSNHYVLRFCCCSVLRLCHCLLRSFQYGFKVCFYEHRRVFFSPAILLLWTQLLSL